MALAALPAADVKVVRLLVPELEGEPSGHLALAPTFEPRKPGMQVTVVTTEESEVHWVDTKAKGSSWDFLEGMMIEVSYLSEDRSGTTSHRARVINWDLDKFLLCAEWVDEPDTNEDGSPKADWISLVEDDWRWMDCRRPDKQTVKHAFRRVKMQRRNTKPSKMKAADVKPTDGGEVSQPSKPTQPQAPRSKRKEARQRPTPGRDAAGEEPLDPSDPTAQPPSAPGAEQHEENGLSSKKPRAARREFEEQAFLQQYQEENAGGDEFHVHIALTIAAQQALQQGKALEERRRAAQSLRRVSQQCGVRGLAMMNQLGLVSELVALLEVEDDNLHQDVAITLINLALYHGSRPAFRQTDVISIALKVLGMDEIRQELALALLQTLSLIKETHSEILKSTFMSKVLDFLELRNMRHKALSVLQHLCSNSENAAVLFNANVHVVLLRDVLRGANDSCCRMRALCSLVSLSSIDPSRFNDKFSTLLLKLREHPDCTELVDMMLHNLKQPPRDPPQRAPRQSGGSSSHAPQTTAPAASDTYANAVAAHHPPRTEVAQPSQDKGLREQLEQQRWEQQRWEQRWEQQQEQQREQREQREQQQREQQQREQQQRHQWERHQWERQQLQADRQEQVMQQHQRQLELQRLERLNERLPAQQQQLAQLHHQADHQMAGMGCYSASRLPHSTQEGEETSGSLYETDALAALVGMNPGMHSTASGESASSGTMGECRDGHNSGCSQQ